MRKKIRLGVIFYGDRGQRAANEQQYSYLNRAMKSFLLRRYDFNTSGRQQLRSDYRKGRLDVVLKNSYGRGHETDLEEMLDRAHIPYLGSQRRAVHLATDKILAKGIYRRAGLPVVRDMVLPLGTASWMGELEHKAARRFGYPYILKDPAGTDSRGIYRIDSSVRGVSALGILQRRGVTHVLVEEFISAQHEVTCLVVGKEGIAYEPVGFVGTHSLLKASVKDKLKFKCVIPAKIPESLRRRAKQISERAHEALGCRDFSRSDMLIRNGKIYLIEVDVHPGFRHESSTTRSIAYEGQTMDDFFLNLI